MATLTVRESFGTVRLARSGRLLPWLGPAMRGLIGGRLRAHVCRWPVAEVLSQWERCAGCPHMNGCQYGETFEPDPPAGLQLASGWENAARPLVIAPAFPAPELGKAKDWFDIRITAIGPTAVGHLDDVWESFRVAGADLAIGLGDDHIPFDVTRTGASGDSVVSLPPPADNGDMVPRVRVTLTAPLFLNEATPDGRKRAVREPTFGQLMRAGLRTLGPLHRLYGEPLAEDVFHLVKVAAEAVPTIRTEFAEFRQERFSNRSKDRYDIFGVTGWAGYGPVPAWLLPWVQWAGRLHVGTHRVAGAGGWSALWT